MRSASIGTWVRSSLTRHDRNGTSGGFTLIEALVALALVLAFAAALAPLLFRAHRIMLSADGQVAAQVLLRSLLDTPPDRASLASATRGGETGGLRWRIVAEPMDRAAWLPSLPPHPRSRPLRAPAKIAPPGRPFGWLQAYHCHLAR